MKININKIFAIISVVLIVNVLISFMTTDERNVKIEEVAYSEFVTMIGDKNIKEVTFNKNDITYITQNNQEGVTKLPEAIGDQDLLNELLKNDIIVTDTTKEAKKSVLSIIIGLFPVIILFFIFFFIMKQQQATKNVGALKQGLTPPSLNPVVFDNVAGCDEAKHEVAEVVDFLKNSEKYLSVGATIPRGILLEGPPGTGKTLMAKAVAGEAGVPFISISGSDFVEKYVGVGASRVREMFKLAKENAPCIIFIDEIDAIGGQRGGQDGGGADSERNQTINQLLTQMDGFSSNETIIVMAATNRADMLDSALRRAGRFDRQVHIGLPDVRGREAILNVHARNKLITENIDFRAIAQGTAGFSGADLANLINEAAIFAVRDNKNIIDQEAFDKAKDKIIMGNAKTSFVMKEKEKSLTAYHEAGHAIVGWAMTKLELHDPVYKVSIIPRERALGVTVYLPEEDKYSLSRGEALARIATLYGGRIAEEMVTNNFDSVTTGASNDIERATSYATNMVTKWGLSSLGSGVRQFSQTDASSEKPFISSETQSLVDLEIQSILNECYEQAEKILFKYNSELEAMHDALMVRETITQDEVESIMSGVVLDEYSNYEDSFKIQGRIYDIEDKVKREKKASHSLSFDLTKLDDILTINPTDDTSKV